ncbi:MAG: glycosyltransferase family 2 protein [Calditrichaeota bacterium]|nr:glycosyltransferase family 2 protein [Calditrichota bacterium]MCB9391166.1 glycosyltransferase family 2 protein [Calditrichota bacterium]
MAVRACVSAIVVTYNSAETISPCLTSLYATADAWLESVVVVDNSSEDDTQEIVSTQHPRAKLLRNAENLGFSRACNIGASAAGGEYLLFLNPDAVVEPMAIAELVRMLDARDEAACCGPLIADEAGTPDPACRRGFPTPWNALGRLFFLENIFPASRTFASYSLPWLGFEREAIVDCVSGACLFIRRSDHAQLGGFDEDYFLFGEDIDLCKRLSDRQRETWYVPSARVFHSGGHSMQQSKLVANREFYRAMRLYLEKHWQTLPRWSSKLIQLGIGFRAWLEKYIGH